MPDANLSYTHTIKAKERRGQGRAAASLAIGIPFSLQPDYGVDEIRTTVQWSVIVLLVAVIAGYTRRISGEADRQRSLALDRLTRLSDANALLFSLHRVAQSLPASLDMDEVLDTTVARLRGLVDFSAVAILLFDDTDAHFEALLETLIIGLLPDRGIPGIAD